MHGEEPVAEKSSNEQKKQVVVPEYALFTEEAQERVRQEYEKPVETGEVEAEERVELTRQSTVPEMKLTERPPVPNKTASPEQQTSTTPKRFDAPSAPRQSATMSKLSRQNLRSELAVNTSAQPTASSSAAKSRQNKPAPDANQAKSSEFASYQIGS